MVSVLSYVIAIIITICLAIILYPIAALFWVLGLFGKISDAMFSFTTKVIRLLWKDINETKIENNAIIHDNQWKCECGHINQGKFCAECGKSMPTIGEEVE